MILTSLAPQTDQKGPKMASSNFATFSVFRVFHAPKSSSMFRRKSGPPSQMLYSANFESYSLNPAQCRTVLMRAGDIREYFSLKKGGVLHTKVPIQCSDPGNQLPWSSAGPPLVLRRSSAGRGLFFLKWCSRFPLWTYFHARIRPRWRL